MNPSNFWLKRLCVAALLAGASAGAAHAEITTYTNQPAFLAAVANPGVDTFDDRSNAFGGYYPDATLVLAASDGSSVTYKLGAGTTESFPGFVSSSPLPSVSSSSNGSDSFWVTANNLTLATPVSEPGAWSLLLAGMALLATGARRRG